MDFDDLDKMLGDIAKEFPKKKKQLVKKAGDILEQNVKNNINSRTTAKTGNLINGVKKVTGSGGGYVAIKPDYKRAPHSFLLENGHRIVKNGVVLGFVNGVHVYRDSATQSEGEILKMAQGIVDEMVKENG